MGAVIQMQNFDLNTTDRSMSWSLEWQRGAKGGTWGMICFFVTFIRHKAPACVPPRVTRDLVASHMLCRPGYRPLLPSQAVVFCAYLMFFLSQKGAQQGQCCASCFLPVLFFWCFQTTFISFLRNSQQSTPNWVPCSYHFLLLLHHYQWHHHHQHHTAQSTRSMNLKVALCLPSVGGWLPPHRF